MKPFAPGLATYTIGLLLLTGLFSFSVQAQQPATEPGGDKPQDTTGKQDPAKPDPTPSDTYVFPTNRERFNRYVKDTVGPFRLARSAFSAGLDQWRDSPEEWGQGMKGYGKRFASSWGRSAIQTTVTYGLDEAFDLDTGFRRSNRNGVGARVKHAFLETITSRTMSGKRVLSAPRLVGVYTGSVIAAETWYPERYSYKEGLRHGNTTLLTSFGINLVREFFINW